MVRFRVDGLMQKKYDLPKTLESDIICRIKILARLRTDEHHIAQDGRFKNIRVSIVPTYYGENAVLRILKDSNDALSLNEIGFSLSDISLIGSIIKKNHGMILITGPTGSGKTTTLYALLKILNTSQHSVITLEDPVEYTLDGIRHIQAHPSRGLSFAQGLRAIVRQDPDIIMVGEIRDKETAGVAVHTALTGHMLLSTLHTIDAATALPRLIEMGIEPYLIASTVNIVISQRLVRKICTHCKRAGCTLCKHSGYKGRIPIYEILVVNEAIRAAIARHASAPVIKNEAQKAGMIDMRTNGLLKVEQGLTSMEEVLSVFYE